MMTDITCDSFNDRLPDLLERELAEPTRSAMERHALSCDDCGSLLADLRKLRIDAASLPPLLPSQDLWRGIAERIDAPVIPIGGGEFGVRHSGHATGPRGVRRLWMIVGAAAAVLVAATSLTTYVLTKRSLGGTDSTVSVAGSGPAVTTPPPVIAQVRATPVDSSTSAPSVRSVVPTTMSRTPAQPVLDTRPTERSAERIYDGEIARLRAVVDARRNRLDPATVGVIERNLKVIDEAIAQCRTALAKDPASRYLTQSLHAALENKVELLRTAATLPART